MFVCSCLAVTDGTVEAAIAAGACSVDEVVARCGAGGRCGGCRPELTRLLARHLGAPVPGEQPAGERAHAAA